MEKFESKIPNKPLFRWRDGVYAGTYTTMTRGNLKGDFLKVCDCDFDFDNVEDREAYAQLFAASHLLFIALKKFVDASTGGDGSFHTSPALLRDCYNHALVAIHAALNINPENVEK